MAPAHQFDRMATSWRITRIGGVLRSLLMSICGVVLLAGGAWILEPSALVAVTRPPEPRSPQQSIQNEFANSLASLMSDCIEILAIANHTPTSQASIVLWMNDDVNPGSIDPQEIAVVSHSHLLRTIKVYSMDATAATVNSGEAAAPERGSVSGTINTARAAPLRLSAPLDRTAVTAPVFCDRWRATPAVQPRTVASGISDMRVESANGGEDDLSVLRLWLRWSADSADGPGEASAFIAPRRSQRSEQR